MNWFTENKIFSSLLVVIALAALALGFLTFSASGKYDEALATYQEGVGKLTGMRALVPYRNADNLKKIQDQVTIYKDLTGNLHDDLLKRQGAIAPMEPATFQGRLREAVSKTIQHANERSVDLGPKFYLGFEKYESELPRNDITGLLNWQLTAIDTVINRLIDLKVTTVLPIVRPPLPGELNPETPSKEAPLLKKYPFEVAFLGYPGNVQSVINDLGAFPQFMIVRALKIENEQPKSPNKDGGFGAVAEAAPVVPAAGAAGAPVAPAVDKIIIGKEKVTATLIIDLVQFTSPATSSTPKK